MEIVNFINDNLFYAYLAINNFLSNPSDTEKSKIMVDFFEKCSLVDNKALTQLNCLSEHYFNKKINKEILKLLNKNEPLENTHIEYLENLKNILETHFANYSSKRPNSKFALEKLQLNEDTLNNILKLSKNNNTQEFLSLLFKLNNFLLNKIKGFSDTEKISWIDTYLYLFIENYTQFLINSIPTDNNISEILLMLQPYLKIKKNNLIPLMFLSKDNNIILDSNMFPDSVHYSNFSSIGVELPKINNLFFVNYLHKSYTENIELSPLFSHEVGHLIDLNFLRLSNAIADDLHQNFYNTIRSCEIDYHQWIRELVADAFGVCSFAWAFFFAQIFSINDDNIYLPSRSHPGISFRLRIIHSYLIKSNYGNLLTPYALQKIDLKLLELQNKFNIGSPQHYEIENILINYTDYIYNVIKDFIEGSDDYVSYENIVELICNNDGNISKSILYMDSQENSLLNLMIKQNLYWIKSYKE